MSSVRSDSSRQPVRQFVSAAPFPANIFSYTLVTNPVTNVTTGTLAANISGANVRSCPAGRILRENGKKLYPGINQGVTTFMIGVIDSQSGISGFIDPNSPLFALYSTDLPAARRDGVDPGPQGSKDVGPPVYTNGDLFVRGDAKINGTLNVSTALISTLVVPIIEIANNLYANNGLFSTLHADIAQIGLLGVSTLGVEVLEIARTLAAYDAGFSTMAADTAHISSLTTSTMLADTAYVSSLNAAYEFVSSMDATNITVSTLTSAYEFVSSMDATNITVSTLTASSFSGSITLPSDAAFSTLTVSSNLIVSSLSSMYSYISSVDASNITVSTLNASTFSGTANLPASGAFSTLTVSSNLIVSSISSMYSYISSIDASNITVSTLNASTFSGTATLPASGAFSTLTVSSNLIVSSISSMYSYISSIDASNITVSTLNASTLNASTLNISYEGDFSMLNASTLNVYSTVTTSTFTANNISSMNNINAYGQIRSLGSTIISSMSTGEGVAIDIKSSISFYTLIGVGDFLLTCSEQTFADRLFLKMAGDSSKTVTFSTGFVVSSNTISAGSTIMSFISDPNNKMYELSRSAWAFA